MTFNELAVGDWFTSPQDKYAVFIKTYENGAICIANHKCFETTYDEIEYSDTTEPAEFCTNFYWDEDTEDIALTHKMEWIMHEKSPCEENSIELGVVYKKDKEYLRKISSMSSVIIFSPDPGRMGKYTFLWQWDGEVIPIISCSFFYPEADSIST